MGGARVGSVGVRKKKDIFITLRGIFFSSFCLFFFLSGEKIPIYNILQKKVGVIL